MKTKMCPRCEEDKPLSEFYKDDRTSSGRQSWCKKCTKEYSRARHRARPRDNADYLLQYRFGISLDEYNEILEAQDGSCAICGRTPKDQGKRLCVDHDHDTDEVRGLLCSECNAGLGRFNDDPDSLRNAADYIEYYM